MHNLFTRTRPSTRPLLSAEDLDQLLNTLDKAALLVDKTTYAIVSVNRKLIELTAHTRDQLTSMLLGDIISGSQESIMAMRTYSREATLPRLELYNRNKQGTYVSVRTSPLSDTTPWALITLEFVVDRKLKRERETLQEDVLNNFLPMLASTTQNENPEEALQQVLEFGQRVLPDSNIAIYIGRDQQPGLRQIAVVGNHQDVYPNKIALPDLNHLLRPSIWHKGERTILTMLHQAARSAGFAYLASTPIAEDNIPEEQKAWLGLILAGSESHPPDNAQQILRVLSGFAAAIIGNNVLLTNLRKQVSSSISQLRAWDAVRENVRDGILTVSPQMEIQGINPVAEIILGYTSSEVSGLPIDNVIIGTDRLMPALRKVFSGIPTPSLGNVYLHRRDGSSFPADLEINPIVSDGETIAGLIFIRDLSENEQIRLRSQQLEQSALLGEVTAIFAHEVRNPINNISLGLQLLERSLDGNEQDKERIQNMQEDCQRLTTLMDSVLTFSRTGNYVFAPVDVEQLVRKILKRWRPRFTKKNIETHLHGSGTIREVMGDLRSLEQVFTNIISNAISAMAETGGTFAVKLSETVNPSGKPLVQIDLSDTGTGIPDENQEKIFEPFFTTNPKGTGLGLSITKQIITAHKGNIILSSFPGGTTFHIQLPTADNDGK